MTWEEDKGKTKIMRQLKWEKEAALEVHTWSLYVLWLYQYTDTGSWSDEMRCQQTKQTENFRDSLAIPQALLKKENKIRPAVCQKWQAHAGLSYKDCPKIKNVSEIGKAY